MQTVFHGSNERRMSLVMPLGPAQQPLAWAWIELPFAPLRQAFEAVPVPSGRLVLQQDTDGGALQLLSKGARAGELEAMAKPVPGSTLGVAVAKPGAYVVLPDSLLLAALLTLLGLGGGVYLLWWRARASREMPIEEIEVPEQTDEPPMMARPDPRPNASKPAAKPPVISPAEVDPSIFRAYDVRGVVGKTLTAEVAKALGQSIGMVMREKGLREIVVGRDGRLSGPELAGALGDGLRAAGIDVIDIGAAPTPVVYFAAYRFNTGSCVAVTGSHNPPDYNGFKIVVDGETL